MGLDCRGGGKIFILTFLIVATFSDAMKLICDDIRIKP